MTEMWDEIQGKWDLVRVNEEYELSEFEVRKFYCNVYLSLSYVLSWHLVRS